MCLDFRGGKSDLSSTAALSPPVSHKSRHARVINLYIGYKHQAAAPVSGSEQRIAKVQGMVDRLFTEEPVHKHPQYATTNDRFLGGESHTSGRHQHAQLRGEQRANEAQVMKTNVRIGQYPGWRPREEGAAAAKKKALPPPPKSMKLSKLSNTDFKSPSSTKFASPKLPKEAPPSTFWSELDMFKTSK